MKTFATSAIAIACVSSATAMGIPDTVDTTNGAFDLSAMVTGTEKEGSTMANEEITRTLAAQVFCIGYDNYDQEKSTNEVNSNYGVLDYQNCESENMGLDQELKADCISARDKVERIFLSKYLSEGDYDADVLAELLDNGYTADEALLVLNGDKAKALSDLYAFTLHDKTCDVDFGDMSLNDIRKLSQNAILNEKYGQQVAEKLKYNQKYAGALGLDLVDDGSVGCDVDENDEGNNYCGSWKFYKDACEGIGDTFYDTCLEFGFSNFVDKPDFDDCVARTDEDKKNKCNCKKQRAEQIPHCQWHEENQITCYEDENRPVAIRANCLVQALKRKNEQLKIDRRELEQANDILKPLYDDSN